MQNTAANEEIIRLREALAQAVRKGQEEEEKRKEQQGGEGTVCVFVHTFLNVSS